MFAIRHWLTLKDAKGSVAWTTYEAPLIQLGAISLPYTPFPATVTAESLVAAGVIRRVKDGVRILSDGEIKAKLAFDVAGASKAAIEKIEKAGGSVKVPEKAAAE